MNKKGVFNLNVLQAAAIAFVVLAVVLAMGGKILTEVQAGQTSGDAAYNATQGGLDAVGEFSDWQETLAIVIVAVIIIGILIASFAGLGGRR